MEITQSFATSPRTPQTDSTGGTSALSSDFQTFLRMLTTQMQNQDPLNPVQSSDFAVQLATFSGVEQQVRTNDLLAGLSSSLGGTALAQFADWVGKEVRSPAGSRFDGPPITVSAPAVADAETAELLVRDQSGRIVDRRPVATQGGEVTWDGIAQTGERFLAGNYSFAVEARAQGQVLYERPAEVYASVSEARVSPSGAVELVLDGGATVSPDRVSALRQPGG